MNGKYDNNHFIIASRAYFQQPTQAQDLLLASAYEHAKH